MFVREEDPDYLDPALSYGSYSAPLVECLFRTLLEYADAPGTAGMELRPELAESLPDVREGGTLYAFRVRPDARFSVPVRRHVTAADFKYSIERLFRVASPGVNFYRGIVGAEAVLAGRDSVLPGVIARGDSLYVRLVRPDPLFLHLLTMTFTSPVPREVVEAHPDDFTHHSVATGPFRVAEYVPRRRVLLVRNADYAGAPAWLDTFELKLGVQPVNAVALIRRGEVDGGMFEVPAAPYARLRRDSLWRRQIELADGLSTEYLWVDVRRPPFDDVRVRQAVAWALDRRAVLKVYSGKGEPAGEFLPTSMPGAGRLGFYPGPDPARARRLLREAGHPNGFSTTLYGMTTEPIPRVLELVQQQLAEVGIRARLELGEAVAYSSLAGDTTRHVPFGWYEWYADYPDPSNFFDTLLNGRRITAHHNNNFSMQNDPALNDAIERTMAIADDSTRARRWRDLDRRVMERAIVMPLRHSLVSRLYAPRLGGWYRHITRILKIESLYVKAPSSSRAHAGRS